MMIDKYFAYKIDSDESICKISLNEDEWLVLLQNIINYKVYDIDSKDNLSLSKIEWIDTNQCIPLCKNDSLFKRYQADTDMISIVYGDRGNIYLRFWLAENNIKTSLNNVMNEIFNDKAPEDILNEFWGWWSKLPIEPQSMGGTLVTKQMAEFGVGHLYAWIKGNLNIEEPKSAGDLYIFKLKMWTYAYELSLLWQDGGFITNDNGKMIPLQQK